MYIVLVSRHFIDDEFTTQFSVETNANTKMEARYNVRILYPPFYMWFVPENASEPIGYCAHFTGEIWRKRNH
jgi:hypothetical protein